MGKIPRIVKDLRKRSTPQEKKLWLLIQDRRLHGFKFRRQVWIDKYSVDFCCLERRLIIELDGGYHRRGSNKQNDFERDKYLRNQRFTILRFWNNEIDTKLSKVREKILYHLFYPSSVPPLTNLNNKPNVGGTSSPARGEEKRK